MTASALAIRTPWHRSGPIAPGGSVLGVAPGAPDQVWLATAAGVWRGDVGRWQPPGPGLPLRATAVLWADGLLFAGDLPSGIRYSADSSADSSSSGAGAGRAWYTAWVDGTTSPVTCFAASPSFAHDRVVLAGTAGAGILRSSDGGRRWHRASVGLADFSILALAVAPSWSPREVAFAATDEAVYRSPNGGRAWKRADRGLEGACVQALAVSPAFAADATVYAGSEQHGVYRSTDGGVSWQPLAASASFGAVNSLCCFPPAGDAAPILIAGTADGALIRSADRGESWAVVADGWPVLALAERAGRIYAGLDSGGLLFSDDAGLSWRPDEQLAAHDITRLAVCEGGPPIAYGPAGGAWRADGAGGWRPLDALDDLSTLFALSCTQADGWFATADAGLFRSVDAGASWQLSLEPDDSRVSVIATNSAWPAELWVGGADGALWHSEDGGRQWRPLVAPADGQPLVALAVAGGASGDRLLVAASFDSLAQRITIWRSTDGGARWEAWLADTTSWTRVGICLGDHAGDHAWVSIGPRLWRWDDTEWRAFELDGTPVAALLPIPGTTTHLAATAGGVYAAVDDQLWQAIEGAPAGLIDMAIAPDGGSTIVGLEPGGVIWEWRLK